MYLARGILQKIGQRFRLSPVPVSYFYQNSPVNPHYHAHAPNFRIFSTPFCLQKKDHPLGGPLQDGIRESITLLCCRRPAGVRRMSAGHSHLFWFDPLLFSKKKDHPLGGLSFWSRIRESNPPSRLGKPLYYRYTNPACIKFSAIIPHPRRLCKAKFGVYFPTIFHTV